MTSLPSQLPPPGEALREAGRGGSGGLLDVSWRPRRGAPLSRAPRGAGAAAPTPRTGRVVLSRALQLGPRALFPNGAGAGQRAPEHRRRGRSGQMGGALWWAGRVCWGSCVCSPGVGSGLWRPRPLAGGPLGAWEAWDPSSARGLPAHFSEAFLGWGPSARGEGGLLQAAAPGL